MQSSRPVKVQDGIEGARMAVKEVFIINQGICITEVQYALMAVALND